MSITTEQPVSGDSRLLADPAAVESAAMHTVRNSQQLMAEAEAWLIDAFSIDPEEIQLGQLQILTAVSSHYAGGLAEFYRNSYMLQYSDIWEPDSCPMPDNFS